MSDVLTEIYNAFNPYRSLQPGDAFYVPCHDVRGNDNILKELGRKILRSRQPTYQLYTGHRGVGKSTELLRLKEDLEKHGFRVIYFTADEDIDDQDTRYTDILLACTRHILEDLKDNADVSPLTKWLSSRWNALKNLALSEIEFDGLQVSAQISQFANLTTTLRQVPSARQAIREQVDSHSVSLIEALNEFIQTAKSNLGNPDLVVIADNLDRIAPYPRDDGRTNHDEIFIDRSEQLRRLNCHIIYTVPISLVYSNRSTQLRDKYGDCQVLPMLMVRTPEGQPYQLGLDRVKALIQQRVAQFAPNKAIDSEIFDSPTTLHQICLASGGHMREVMQLMQTSIDWTDELPITASALKRAITRARTHYHSAVDDKDWSKLAQVYRSKQIPNEDDYRKLLFDRCLLEYRFTNEKDDQYRWHDVHPLIEGIQEFQTALAQLPQP